MKKDKIELGDIVRDRISGMKGIAIIELRHVTGCLQFSVQPFVNESTGYLPEKKSFDLSRLELIEKKVFENNDF